MRSLAKSILALFFFSVLFISCKQSTEDDPDGGTTGETIAFTEQTSLPMSGGYVTGVGFMPSGKMAAVIDRKLFEVSADGSMRLVSGDSIHNEMAVGPDGTVYTGVWTDVNSLRRYDMSTGTFVTLTLPNSRQNPPPDISIKFSPAGELFISFINKFGGNGDMYYSTNKGDTWTSLQPPMQYSFDLVFTPSGDIISGGHNNTQHIIAKTTDRGVTWETLSTHPVNQMGLHLFLAANGDLFSYEDGGNKLNVSHDGGKTFAKVTWPTTHPYIHAIMESGSALYMMGGYAGGSPSGSHRFGGLMRSDDGGQTWKNIFLCPDARAIALNGSKMAVGSQKGLYYTEGSGWTNIGTNTVETLGQIALDKNGNLLLVADGDVYRKSNGAWFTLASSVATKAIAVNGAGSIVVSSGLSLVHSTDNGSTWEYSAFTTGVIYIGSPSVMDIVVAGNDFYACIADYVQSVQGYGAGELIKSSDGGKTFTSTFSQHNFTDLVTDGIQMYGVWEYVQGVPKSDKLSSINSGLTWTPFTGQYYPLAFNSLRHSLSVNFEYNNYGFHYVNPSGALVKTYKVSGLPSSFFVRSMFFGPDDKVYSVIQGSGAAAIKTAIYVSNAPVK